MIHYTRGSKIIVETVFRNSTGGIANPSSVNITFAYPEYSTRDGWPFDATELLTTTVAMTSPSDSTLGVWTSTWDSSPSNKGLVYWSAVPANLTYGVNEGQFMLRGGLANPAAVATTL